MTANKKNLPKLQIGDIVITYFNSFGSLQNLEVVEVVKINKKTYKLSNGDLMYIHNWTERGGYDSWGNIQVYIPFSPENLDRITRKFFEQTVKEASPKMMEMLEKYGEEVIMFIIENAKK